MIEASSLSHPRRLRTNLAICLLLIVLSAAAMACVDVPVANWVHRHIFSRFTKYLLQFCRAPGNYLSTALLAGILLMFRRCQLRAAILLLSVGAAASAITGALKLCCGRIRPFHGRAAFDWTPFTYSPFDTLSTRNLSFPSGDATLAFATAAVFVVIEPRFAKYAITWAIIVGMARVLQGAHYVSDIAAGGMIGILTATAGLWLFPLKNRL